MVSIKEIKAAGLTARRTDFSTANKIIEAGSANVINSEAARPTNSPRRKAIPIASAITTPTTICLRNKCSLSPSTTAVTLGERVSPMPRHSMIAKPYFTTTAAINKPKNKLTRLMPIKALAAEINTIITNTLR